MTDVNTVATNHSFARCFILKPARFAFYQSRLENGSLHPLGRTLSNDIRKDSPWANALLLLLYAYNPLPAGAGLSGYYLASNAAYHAANGVLADLAAAGIRADRCHIPVRECAMASGLGTPMKNGLTAWEGLGTRAVVQTIAAELAEPVIYEEPHPQKTEFSACENCHACENACPADAISDAGLHCFSCLRGNMDGETMPERVMESMPSLLGCELCQYACPINASIPSRDIPLPAFTLETLLSGNVKPALALVGKNENKGGRLIAHAAVLAANRGRKDLLPLIRRWKDDDRPLVNSCACWAESRLNGED